VLPPLLRLLDALLLAIPLILSINQPAELAALATNHHNNLAGGGLQRGDVRAVGARQRLDDVHQRGLEVLEHVDEAGGRREGQHVGGPLDARQRLPVQRVVQLGRAVAVVRRQRRRVRLRVHRLQRRRRVVARRRGYRRVAAAQRLARCRGGRAVGGRVAGRLLVVRRVD